MIDYPAGINYNKADYLGAASIFINPEDTATFEAKVASGIISDSAASGVDSSLGFKVTGALIIENIAFELVDRHQLVEYFGDTHSTVFFGRNPTILQCGCKLTALRGSNTKRNFMSLYRDVFRLRKVARHGIVPCIEFTGLTAMGAFLDLHIDRNSMVDDLYSITFKFVVFRLIGINLKNKSGVTKVELNFS